MFTGIIKGQTSIKIIEKTDTDLTLAIQKASLPFDAKLGDSIALDGTCLTVSKINDASLEFNLMNETLEKTNFKNLKDEYKVNFEDSIRIGDKLDGHIVYGDVDCVGEIIDIKNVGDSKVYTFKHDPEFSKYIIDKGRITIDGASLTSINSGEGIFSVALIPHSLSILNLGTKVVGDKVNLEFDVYAKYIYKQGVSHG